MRRPFPDRHRPVFSESHWLVPILAGWKSGRISAPRLPQAVQTNRPSTSETLTSSVHWPACISIKWLWGLCARPPAIEIGRGAWSRSRQARLGRVSSYDLSKSAAALTLSVSLTPARGAPPRDANKATANQSPCKALSSKSPIPKERLRVSNWIVQGLYDYAVSKTVEL